MLFPKIIIHKIPNKKFLYTLQKIDEKNWLTRILINKCFFHRFVKKKKFICTLCRNNVFNTENSTYLIFFRPRWFFLAFGSLLMASKNPFVSTSVCSCITNWYGTFPRLYIGFSKSFATALIRWMIWKIVLLR